MRTAETPTGDSALACYRVGGAAASLVLQSLLPETEKISAYRIDDDGVDDEPVGVFFPVQVGGLRGGELGGRWGHPRLKEQRRTRRALFLRPLFDVASPTLPFSSFVPRPSLPRRRAATSSPCCSPPASRWSTSSAWRTRAGGRCCSSTRSGTRADRRGGGERERGGGESLSYPIFFACTSSGAWPCPLALGGSGAGRSGGLHPRP